MKQALGPHQKLYEAHQVIARPLSEVFPFFANAKNLERITPPWLHFQILNQSTPEIQEGTIFDYQLRVKGIRLKWRSRIEEWSNLEKFVDVQLKGPYKTWHHTHEFKEIPEGTHMTDRVIYELPFGGLGRLCAGWLVDKDVRQIFEYRSKIIEEIFS